MILHREVYDVNSQKRKKRTAYVLLLLIALHVKYCAMSHRMSYEDRLYRTQQFSR